MVLEIENSTKNFGGVYFSELGMVLVISLKGTSS